MRNNPRLVSGILCAIFVVCCSCSTNRQAVGSEPPADAEFFPITPWETPWSKRGMLADPRYGVASLRECGYTTAAFVTPDQLPLCEKAGMRALVGRPEGVIKWREMSDEQIFQTVKKLVDDSRGSKAVMGYFLMDEPGVRFFPALAKAVAAVKKLAPGKLAYINLYPNYATLGAPNLSQIGTEKYSEYLERYVSEVKPQFISYDNYQVQFSNDLTDGAKAKLYWTNLLEVRRVALEHNLPFWNIVSGNQVRKHTPVPSPANLLVQAYTTLAAGAKGLTWYTYYAGGYGYSPIDKAGNRTRTWSYLKMVNDQVKVIGPMMSGLRSTGVFFTSPAPAEGLPVLPGKLVQSVESSPAAPAMVGEFSGSKGETYVMLVNLSLERSSKFLIKTNVAPDSMRSISPVDGALSPLEADGSLWLPAGQGALIRLQ